MKNENLEKYLKDIDNLGYEKCMTLNSLEVSKILGIRIRTLNNWRNQNIGPTSKRVGKAYIYTKRDIAEFLATS
jgi:hypothetical protein